MDTLITIVVVLFAVLAGAGLLGITLWLLKRGRRGGTVDEIQVRFIAEKVRAVGKLVGLEVHAKEIATARKGWDWIPPLLLSQAKIAMIFQFEKQYSVNLALLTEASITERGEGSFRITLPPIEGSLRLVDVHPYDIQQGRVLGLIDVINMNAERQGKLMKTAQHQAAELFEKTDARYRAQAADAIEKQLGSLLQLFNIRAEIVWQAGPSGQLQVELDDRLKTGPMPIAS